jgi:hypothetical protein
MDEFNKLICVVVINHLLIKRYSGEELQRLRKLMSDDALSVASDR